MSKALLFYINFPPLLFVWVVDLVESQIRSFVLRMSHILYLVGCSLVVTFNLFLSPLYSLKLGHSISRVLIIFKVFVCLLFTSLYLNALQFSVMASAEPSYRGSVRSTRSSPDSLPVHLSLVLLSWYLWRSCYFFSLISSWAAQVHCSLLRGSFFLLWPRWLLNSLEKPFWPPPEQVKSSQ